MRIGEASNPGPRNWRIASVNTTTWSAGLPILCRQEFDAVCIQETMRFGESLAYSLVEGNNAGYHTAMNPCYRTAKGGMSGGVAISSLWKHGLTELAITDIVSIPTAHRFIFRHFHGFARGGIGIGSVYLESAVGMNSNNDALMRSIAGFVKAWGRPFVLAGDWNMSPKDLRDSGWPELLNAVVICTDEHTYEAAGHTSELDFFLVEKSIAHAVDACEVKDEVSVSKHRLVCLELRGDFKEKKVMRMRKPRPLPTFPPSGPFPQPPLWDDFQDEARAALASQDLEGIYA